MSLLARDLWRYYAQRYRVCKTYENPRLVVAYVLDLKIAGEPTAFLARVAGLGVLRVRVSMV
jgi:hypothetical protein